MSEPRNLFELRINYPNGFKQRQEFETETEARDRASHLADVHRCKVDLNKIQREEICTYWREMENPDA